MALYKLEDFDPKYQDAVGRDEIKGLDVYTDKDDEKAGTVKNILVDEAGRLRYLVVDTGFGFLVSKYCYQLGVPVFFRIVNASML